MPSKLAKVNDLTSSALTKQTKLGRLSNNVLAWDDFDRSDRTLNGDLTPDGLPWLVSGPGYLTAAIASGATVTTANTYMFVNTGTAVTDFTAIFSVNVRNEASAIMHVAASTDLNNMLHLQISERGWSIDKRIGGTWTNAIASGIHRLAISHAARYSMRIKISGTVVTIVGVDGLETSVTVADIASMGTLSHVGIQSSQATVDNSRFYGISVGSAIRQPLLNPDAVDIRGRASNQRRSLQTTLTGAAGWYRLATKSSSVGLTFGIVGKVEISAVDAVGRCTHGEFNCYGLHSGGMGINKVWSFTRFSGAITQARISRLGTSPFDVFLDLYKANADDVSLDVTITGLMIEQSTLTGGVSAGATEEFSITF